MIYIHIHIYIACNTNPEVSEPKLSENPFLMLTSAGSRFASTGPH